MNHEQPTIHADLLQRLRWLSTVYEMEPGRMLNLILSVSFDELEGQADDFTVYVPTGHEDAAP